MSMSFDENVQHVRELANELISEVEKIEGEEPNQNVKHNFAAEVEAIAEELRNCGNVMENEYR